MKKLIKRARIPFRFILAHPLARKQKVRSLIRLICWQARCLFTDSPKVVPLVENSRIIIKKGLRGATGNYYSGLHDFEEMGFLLHFLRKDDLFFDIGANVGSYSILAGGVIGSEVISIEPIFETYLELEKNILLNEISKRVTPLNIGLGEKSGVLEFVFDEDTSNRVALPFESQYKKRSIEVKMLDQLTGQGIPSLIKIDVEGYELHVLKGGLSTLIHPALKAVIIEINSSNLRYDVNENEIHEMLTSHGFKSFTYDPFSRRLCRSISNQIVSNFIFLRDFLFVEERVSLQRKISIQGIDI